MKLILVLPCLTQTRGWPAADVAEYERIKGLADKVVYTSQAYTVRYAREQGLEVINLAVSG